MKPGDRAGLALFNRPYAWIGVEMDREGPALTQVTEGVADAPRVRLGPSRVWLRAACDFLSEEARFSYSTDGRTFQPIGPPFRMVFQLLTFQGVRYSLFNFNAADGGGVADFDAVDVHEPNPRGLTRPIPVGSAITLSAHGAGTRRWTAHADRLVAEDGPGTPLRVVGRGLGRVALESAGPFVALQADGRLAIDPQEGRARRDLPVDRDVYRRVGPDGALHAPLRPRRPGVGRALRRQPRPAPESA